MHNTMYGILITYPNGTQEVYKAQDVPSYWAEKERAIKHCNYLYDCYTTFTPEVQLELAVFEYVFDVF